MRAGMSACVINKCPAPHEALHHMKGSGDMYDDYHAIWKTGLPYERAWMTLARRTPVEDTLPWQ